MTVGCSSLAGGVPGAGDAAVSVGDTAASPGAGDGCAVRLLEAVSLIDPWRSAPIALVVPCNFLASRLTESVNYFDTDKLGEHPEKTDRFEILL